MDMKISLLLAIGLLPLSLKSRAQLVINEVMQSNVDCIMDDINEFPDSWVEIYNTGTKAENLSAYKIGVTDDASSAWQLPSVYVSPKNYVLVYCDKEATGIHADFRLESGKGGAVYLITSAGDIADQITGMKKQPAPNVSYGRRFDAADEWGYQKSPTPAASNCGSLVSEVLGQPLFSQPGRVVESGGTFTLQLSLPDGVPEGTVIRYTTDGSEPTSKSQLYTNPININATKVVRATTFCDGYISPRSVTQSYITHGRKVTIPVVSIVTDSKYLYDNKIGIYVDGTYSSEKKNYKYDWRRPLNIEIFWNKGDESVINQLGEARIQGGASRGSKLKSLAVYANKRFGEKRFKYEFFPDSKPGANKYKSFLLRNAGNDFDYLYMRDAVIQMHVSKYMDIDWQAWQPAAVYMNGEYKGVLCIRDRSNDDYVYTYYDELEDIDVVENWNSVKHGDDVNLNAFKAFYSEHGHTRGEYDKWMDTREFMDMMITGAFYCNVDFPGNNIMMWRPRTEEGRWRWIFKDFDYTMGLYGGSSSYKYLEWLHYADYDSNLNWGANSYDGTRLFRRLMEDDDFKNDFIDRCAVYMGDFLNLSSMWKTWEPMYDMIKTEYPYHRNLINRWWPNYSEELQNAKTWVSERPASFYQQVADYYKLGSPCQMTVNKSLTTQQLDSIQVEFNGIQLSEGVFDGKFFANRNVTLRAEAAEGMEVKGWTVRTTKSSSTTTTEVDGAEYSFVMPQCTRLVINARLGTLDGINTIGGETFTWKRDGNNIILSGLLAGEKVSVCDLSGRVLNSFDSDGGGDIVLEIVRPLVIVKAGGKVIKVLR